MTSEIRLYLVTWNVGESNPPDDLGPLLGLNEKELPDLYAIGLQELKSDTTTLISDSLFDDPWTNAISSTLCQRGYVRVKSLRLVGIHLSVYIKRSQLLDISTIESEFTRTGYAGLWGSKGGVSIRLDVHGVNLCFINSHFSAHQENFALRIEDYNQVLMSQKFRDPDCPRILDNDYVFWLGDLNFRLNDLSNEVVRQKVGSEEYEELLKHDQLNDARSKNMIFLNFEEGGISFPPTFKFDVGTDTYDTSSKCRIPAWCDRILWRVHEDAFAGTTLSVKQHKYTSLPEYKNSDHKPVVSSFTIKVLQDSPIQPVMFEPLSCWSRGKDQKVTYSISKVFPTCGRDWIGLYPVNFKNFEEYSTYNWVPQRGEDNQDGTFLCSIVFEERDLRSLPSGRYKLLYFSAVHNHAVGYSDELELLELDHATSSEDELVRPGEADVDQPLRVTPDAQPSGLRATKHPLDPASSEVDSEEKPMKKVEEIIEKEQVEPVKMEKLETPETEKEKVVCEVEKPTTDEKVVCEVEKPTTDEKVVCEVEKPTTDEKVVCEVEKPTTDEKVVCEVEKPTTVEKVVYGVEKPATVEKVVYEVEKPASEEKVMCKVEKPTIEEKVVCEVEKPITDEKVVCEVEKSNIEETLPKGEDFVPAIENLNVEVMRLPREIEEPFEEIEKLTTEIKELSSEIAKLDAEVENGLTESENLPLEIKKLSSERNSTDKLIVEVGKLPEEVEKEDHQLPLSTGPEKCSAPATPAIESPTAEVTETEKSAVDSAPVKIMFHHDGKAAAVGEDHHQHEEQKDQVVSESPKYPQGVEEVVNFGEVSGTPSAAVEESYEDIDIISSPTPEAIKRLTEELSDPKTKLLSYEEFHKEIEAAFSSRDMDGAVTRFDVPKLLDPLPPMRTEVPGAARGEEVPLRNESEENNEKQLNLKASELEENKTCLTSEEQTVDGTKSDGKVPPSVEDDSKAVRSLAMKTEFEPMIRLEDIQKEHDYSKRIEPSPELESRHQVEKVSPRTADASDDVAETERLQMVVDMKEKKALDGLNASAVQETSVDRSNIIIIQQEQQKQTTLSDAEALESPKRESSQDVEKMSKDIQASDQVPFEIVEEVVLAKNTSVQAAFKPEEDISSVTDSKKESLKELEIEKDEESESQTQSSSSDFEVIQLPSKHSPLESFEDAYLSMRGEALADKEDVEDAGKETMEKVAVQSALRSTESEPKDPELIESINAQLLEQNMSGFVESLGDFGADDLPSIEDSANVKLEQATKSSIDGKMEESKQEEECIVVKEGVVYEGDETSIKTESDLLPAEVKVAKESQPQVERTSEKKVVEFVDNVVATAVQEAVTSCLSLEDDRPKHEPQETFVSQNDEKVKTKVSEEIAPSCILESIEQVEVVRRLDVASHPHIEEDKVEVTEQQQHHRQEKPQQIQQQEHVKDEKEEIPRESPAAETGIRLNPESEVERQQQQELLHETDLADLAQQSQQALPRSDVEVKKEPLTASFDVPPSTSDLETGKKHLEVQPPQSPEKEKHAPSELSTDDRLKPSEGQKGAPNFFDAYMDLREKSLADKEQEDKNEKRKEDPIPSTIITQGALKDVDTDLIGKNLSDLSEDMGLEEEKPKDEPKKEEQDGKYEARKEAELLIGDELKTKSRTIGDSQHHDVTLEQPELVKEDTAALSQESLVVDSKQVLRASEMPFEGDCSTGKEVQSTGTTVFQAPAQDPSLEKTELYQTKPSEVREEIHEPTNQ